MNNKSGMCTAALVLGIVGFFINPLYLVSTVGLVFGIIGLCEKPEPSNKGSALAGVILCPCAIILQLIIDTVLTICTLGVGGLSYCC